MEEEIFILKALELLKLYFCYNVVIILSVNGEVHYAKDNAKYCNTQRYQENNSIIKRVREIKMDCENLCETSGEAEKQLHKGNT